jgi:hypothetical protein
MTLDKLDYNGLYTIAENMRPADAREIYATRWDEDPGSVAREALALSYDFGWIAAKDDRPICAIGAVSPHPGLWSVWMFATPEFPKIGLGVTKFALRYMKPALLQTGHRLECRSIDGHTDAHKWLEFCGFTRESSLPKYGKNGETFHIYSITN